MIMEAIQAKSGGAGGRARVDVNELRKPLDFVLKGQHPGSLRAPGARKTRMAYRMLAMSMKYLGETIDIHSGGQDLIFLIMKMK